MNEFSLFDYHIFREKSSISFSVITRCIIPFFGFQISCTDWIIYFLGSHRRSMPVSWRIEIRISEFARVSITIAVIRGISWISTVITSCSCIAVSTGMVRIRVIISWYWRHQRFGSQCRCAGIFFFTIKKSCCAWF